MLRPCGTGTDEIDNDGLAAQHPSPRTIAGSAPACAGNVAKIYTRTPRPMRSRVTADSGRSPGLRVVALDHLPRTVRLQWFNGRKLAAHSCGGSRGLSAFPFDPLREPLPNVWQSVCR